MYWIDIKKIKNKRKLFMNPKNRVTALQIEVEKTKWVVQKAEKVWLRITVQEIS